MSSDRSQTQKATDCMIPFIGHSGEVRIRGIKKKKIQVTGCQGLRVEEGVVTEVQEGMWGRTDGPTLSLNCVEVTSLHVTVETQRTGPQQ